MIPSPPEWAPTANVEASRIEGSYLATTPRKWLNGDVTYRIVGLWENGAWRRPHVPLERVTSV